MSTPSSRSQDLFRYAKGLIPGGVNSPARAFKAVGGEPPFIASAKGSKLRDEDGKTYLDYIGSWGPMILGHGFQPVVDAVRKQAEIGMSYGAPTELEVRMASLLVEWVPCVEQIRMVNSGTEATMSAIRLARAATRRDLIIKFEGCYHGHGDAFLAKAGSGLATLGEPTSPGVPKGAAECTLNARYNDLASVAALFDARPEGIAGVIVEPVVGNMGTVLPKRGFLEGLRELCTRYGAVLIFDEVMTGFRLAAGGAQELYGVTPDLCTLGKIVGGGLPVGAYGGKRELMEVVAPAGPMYQAGTLSGNPLAMAAGLAQVGHLVENREAIYAKLEADGAFLEKAAVAHAKAKGYPIQYQRVGSMATLFFAEAPVLSWDDAAKSDTKRFAKYFWHLMENGVYMPCSQYEAFFHSTAHSAAEIEETAAKMAKALDHAFA